MFKYTVHSIPELLVFCSFLEGLIENFLFKRASLHKSPYNETISLHGHSSLSVYYTSSFLFLKTAHLLQLEWNHSIGVEMR